MDGSVEALSDMLARLSTEEIHINILHKGVGQITESDVLLASASDAIIIILTLELVVMQKNLLIRKRLRSELIL